MHTTIGDETAVLQFAALSQASGARYLALAFLQLQAELEVLSRLPASTPGAPSPAAPSAKSSAN